MAKALTRFDMNSSCKSQLSKDPSLGLLSLMLPELSMMKQRSTFVWHVGSARSNVQESKRRKLKRQAFQGTKTHFVCICQENLFKSKTFVVIAKKAAVKVTRKHTTSFRVVFALSTHVVTSKKINIRQQRKNFSFRTQRNCRFTGFCWCREPETDTSQAREW